jgi:hypothetical protein
MIPDLDKTIEKILYANGGFSRNDIDVSFDTPDREWSSRLSRPSINCWAFDLRENMKLRSLERQVSRNGTNTTTLYPSYRMDVTYLITAWARKMEDEHRLLWRALAALKRAPLLKPRDCEGELRYQQHDVLMLTATPSDHPTNMVDLWGVVDNVMHMGFTLCATLELERDFVFTAPAVSGPAIISTGFSDNPETGTITTADVRAVDDGENKPSS